MFCLYVIKSQRFRYCLHANNMSVFWLVSVSFGDPACQKVTVTVVLFFDGYVNKRLSL